MLRRAVISVTMLALAVTVACLPSLATAAPTVTFKVKAVPIPGYRGTGNILGAGAALEVKYTIKGSEYGGFPPPLIGVNFFTPAGTKLNTHGFVTCAPSALQNFGPRACPRKSRVTISGSALGVVSFGSERVNERASIAAFFAPGGALQFYTAGSSPVSLEFLSPSHVAKAQAPYAQEFVTSVPLIETVPGAPDASALSIGLTIGAAMRHGKRVSYYGRVPKRCPKGGFPLKSELLFAAVSGLPPQTVTVNYKAPCPRAPSQAPPPLAITKLRPLAPASLVRERTHSRRARLRPVRARGARAPRPRAVLRVSCARGSRCCRQTG